VHMHEFQKESRLTQVKLIISLLTADDVGLFKAMGYDQRDRFIEV